MKFNFRSLFGIALALLVSATAAHAAATLKVSGVTTAPGSAQPGQTVQFTVTVTNTATAPTGGGTANDFAGGTVDIGIKLTSLTTAPIILGSQAVALPAITAEGTGSATVSFTIPTKYSQGGAYFVTADVGFRPGVPAAGTAVMNGGVTSVGVTSFGSNYSTPPTVNFTGGGGSGATALAIVAGGAVIAVDILTPGTGYTSTPTVSFTNPGTGSGAAATAVINGPVASVTMTNPGSGYNSTPVIYLTGGGGGTGAGATATLSSAGVSSISVNSAGTGYTSAPTVAITGGGGGSGAAATANITNVVNSITLVGGGSGYTTPTVTITGSLGGGSGASATATVVGGIITAIVLNSGGSGYDNTVNVVITDPGVPTTPASATATVTGIITGITVTAPGSGYTSVPTVTLSGGGGSGGTASASLSNTTVSSVSIGSGSNPGGSGYTTAPTVVFSGGGPVTSGNGSFSAGSQYTTTTQVITVSGVPDLVVTGVNYPAGVAYKGGDVIPMSLTYANHASSIGAPNVPFQPSNAVPYFRIQVVLSNNPTFGDADDFQLTYLDVPVTVQADDAIHTFSWNQLLPGNFAGSYYVLAKIDSLNQVTEAIETSLTEPGNNTWLDVAGTRIALLPTTFPTMYMASTATTGVSGNGYSDNPTITADGRYTVYASDASNLILGSAVGGLDTNSVRDIFLYDNQTGTTRRLNLSQQGAQANAASNNPFIASDGRYVAFSSDATNLIIGDTNGFSDIFVVDVITGAITLDSVASNPSASVRGAQANGSNFKPSLSADGRYLVFESSATNLVSPPTTVGVTHIYLRDRTAGTTTLISRASGAAGAEGNGNSIQAMISGDGNFVAYASLANNLVAGDTNGLRDVFVRDIVNNTTTRVSVGVAGAQSQASPIGGDSRAPSISKTGRYIAFSSEATNLVGAADTNGMADIFVYDRQNSTTSRVSVSTSGGQAIDPAGNPFVLGSINPNISETGRFVTFASMASNLAPGDTAGRYGTLAAATLTGTSVSAVTITNPGVASFSAYYTAVPRVTISGGGGSGAAATPTLSNGASGYITGFTLNAGGLNYTSPPTVTIAGTFNASLNIYVIDRAVDNSPVLDTPGNIATSLVSVNKFGYQTMAILNTQSTAAADIYPVISADGRWVAMPSDAEINVGLGVTTTNLLHNDSNGARDVFLHDRRINALPGSSSGPVVTITSPGTGAQLLVNSPVSITASATAATVNGTILGVVSSVQFYVNGNSVGTTSTFPYSAPWTPTAVGTYTLSALVTDSFGNIGVSPNVTVSVNATPSVGITNPVGGSSIVVNTVVNLAASAAASNPGGVITSVQFFANGVAIGGADTTSPYGAVWTPTAVGTYSLTAVAIETIAGVPVQTVQTTSPVVTVSVVSTPGGGSPNPPIVSLTPPPPTTASVNGRITLTATATPGTSTTAITRVDFYAGATLIGSTTAAPYSVVWVPAAVGIYNVTAVATDNLGASTTSAVSVVNVNGVLSVAVTNPTVTSVIPVNTPQTVTAIASMTTGTVVSVQFFANGSSIGTASAFPYSVSWTPATTGAYSLTATATDNTGAQAVSSAVLVNVTSGTAPAVVIASPTAGTTVAAGTLQTIVANVFAGSGTIANVQFFANGVSLGTDLTFPYNQAWTPAGPGSVALTAVATDTLGNQTTSAVVNVVVATVSAGVPSVAITNPLGGASIPIGTTTTIAATATDADGTIANVQFFANGVLLGSDATYPYSIPFAPVATGTYTLTAVATDNGGNTTTSAPVIVTISGGTLPAVAITAPAAGSILEVNTAQTIFATATSSSGVIASVQFFVNGVALSTATTFPYSATWTPTALGSYSLTARALDTFGNVTESAAVLTTVVAGSPTLPRVALTSTPSGTNVTVNSEVFVSANATDPDGTIASVEFYVNDQLIGAKGTYPYYALWTPPNTGTYTIKAIATDNAGNRVTSAVSTINATAQVGAVPVVGFSFNNPALDTPTGTPPVVAPFTPVRVDYGSKLIMHVAAVKDDGTITNVQFFANGASIASLTAAPFFTTYQLNTLSNVVLTALVTDSSGNTIFTEPILITTVPAISAASSVVTLVSPLDGSTYVTGGQITFSATHNFGNVVPPKIDFYVNGSQFTTVTSGTGTTASAPYQFVVGLARAGTYIIHAVGRVGTTTTVSAPVRITVTSSRAPAVAITSPAVGTTYTVGTSLTIAANATSSTGLISSVQFFVNGAALSTKTTLPYTAAWNPGSAGIYTLTALATDDSGNQTLSPPVILTLIANGSPMVTISNPTSGTTVNAGSIVNLVASASDADGTVVSVRFLVNGNAVGLPATAAPFSSSWTPTVAGTYTVIAQATDNTGNVSNSAPITLTVTGNRAPSISITAPASGNVVRTGTATTLVATASDSDGTVASVQFFANGTAIGTALTTVSPLGGYRTPWTPTAEGVYRLTAVVIDNAGAATTSAPSTVLAISAASGGVDNVYSGTYSGISETGRFAVISVRGKTAAFIGYSTTGAAKTYYFPGLAVDGSGSFSLADSLGRTVISGSISDSGVSGSLDANRAIFIGPVVFPSASTVPPGYYTGNLTGRAASNLAAIVGADGSIMFYAADGTFQVAGAGTVDGTGSFNVAVTGGARFTGKIDAATGFLTGSLSGNNGGAFTAATASGVSFSDGFLRNLSTRGQVGTGGNILIAGFVVGGTVPKQVLVRAIGPTLTDFGVTGVLADPQLQLYNSSGALVIANNNWGGAGDVINASLTVGAFPLAAGSFDAVVLVSLSPGAYTAQVSGAGGGTGVALVELYDVDSLQPFSSQKVMNVATRGVVGTGQGQLIAGFVVSGNTAKKVLIRGVGPTLAAAPFNVGGVLTDPVLRLVRADGLVIRENDNWEAGNDAGLINDAATKVGAFPLASGGKDSAMLINLPPGTYNAQVTGSGSTTGVALIEVYEVP